MRWGAVFVIALLAQGADARGESLVATRVISAQAVLTPEDIAIVDAAIPGAVGDLTLAVGKAARRAIYPGRPILSQDIGPPILITRNQTVVMRFTKAGLEITAEGRALDKGGADEVIRVLALSSKTILSARIAADGSVMVEEP